MKTFLIVVCFGLCFIARSQSSLCFENKELESQVNTFVTELKEKKFDTLCIIEAYRIKDSVYITLINSYPNTNAVNLYTKYRGVYFCCETSIPGYFKIVNPEKVPSEMKKKNQELSKQLDIVTHEPFVFWLIFYNGKLIKKESSDE